MATPLNRRSKTVDSETQRHNSSHTIVQRRVAQLTADIDPALDETGPSDPARRRAHSLLSAQPRPAPCVTQEEAARIPRPKRSSSSIQRMKNADRFENKGTEDTRRDGLAQRTADTRSARHAKWGSVDHSDPADGCSSAASDKNALGGPSLSSIEFEKMKREIEALKETLHESKRAAKRHLKKLEDQKAELSSALQATKERELELANIKAKSRASEELLSTIESTVQCQICMDLPDKPYSLAPCGHVLCLSCLQEWFRKAPPSTQDMDVDPDELTDPSFVLRRKKTCPSCRTVVKHRPSPVFMVKAVVTALKKAKPSTSPAVFGTQALATVDEDHPWKGIFPSSDEEEAEGHSSDSYPSESDYGDYFRHRYFGAREDVFHDSHGDGATDSEFEDEDDSDQEYDTHRLEHSDEDDFVDEDEDEDREQWVLPRWQPPRTIIDISDYHIPQDLSEEDQAETIRLLRRGCTWDMLVRYHVSYEHNEGIVIRLSSLDEIGNASDSDEEGGDSEGPINRLYLGWNIELGENDSDGSRLLTEALADIKHRPERWLVRPRANLAFAFDAKKLVSPEDVEEYDTTDTEVWADAEDF